MDIALLAWRWFTMLWPLWFFAGYLLFAIWVSKDRTEKVAGAPGRTIESPSHSSDRWKGWTVGALALAAAIGFFCS